MHKRPSSLRAALERTGRFTELLVKHAIIWAVQAIVLLSMAGIFVGIVVNDYEDAFIVIVVVAGIGSTLMPALFQVAVRLMPIVYPVVTFLLYAWALLLLDQVLPGWKISNWWVAGLTAAVLTAVSALLGSFLSLSDDAAWQRYALSPIRARYAGNSVTHTDVPGFVFLEIDGLAAPVLRNAIRAGYAPNLARWLERGSHQLTEWECDLSSQTSAMQAGILLGANRDIPAFRWYDRELGRVVVSNRASDAGLIERELSSGNGLLVDDGASRGNMFSGDAPDSLFTFSSLSRPAPHNKSEYFFFYTNLYNLARTMALFVADFFHELLSAAWQLVRNERPRVRRLSVYPFVRAATTSILRELSTFTVAGDMIRGVNAIYTTYVAYDEVAHHSGIERGDTLRVLRTIDRDIGRLEKVAEEAPRPYHLIVLSDHGQTQGATFRQRYGESLSDVVEQAIEKSGDAAHRHQVVRPAETTEEGSQMVSVLVRDFLRKDENEHPIVERALRGTRIMGDDPNGLEGGEGGDVLVLASGNLGLISFAGVPKRLTLQALSVLHPDLLSTLVDHPGIAFLMVETESRGPMVIGRGGFHALRDGVIEGVDPLEGYGPNAPSLLRRSSSFRNAPDILVVSTWWRDTSEVAAFEELVGSHGGLGGYQTRPFVLSPVELEIGPEPIVGAEAVYTIFKQWVTGSGAHGH
jgi:uncharacterized membrane protein YvlD (DUF360 family)